MNMNRSKSVVSSLAVMSLMTPILAGCSNPSGMAGSSVQQAPSSQANYGSVPAPRNAPQQNQGMSTGKKVAILAGAAALYYLYNKHKNAKGTGINGQYYRSKNGRIYYRDEKGNAVYVTPPPGGIQVPADVAEQYNRAAQSGNFDNLPVYNDNMGNMSGGNMGNMGNMGGNQNYGNNPNTSVPGPRGNF